MRLSFPIQQSLLVSGGDTDRGHADGAFFGAFDADDGVYVVVVKGAYLACAEVEAGGC